MKNMSILTTLILSILIAQPGSDIPGNMSYQGFLTDSEGEAYVDGEYSLTFRLVHVMDDGSEETLWEEAHNASITNGVFSVVLGSVVPLPLTMSPNMLLETQVGDEVLSPRQSLTSVPFALKSSRSQQAYQSVHADTAVYMDLSNLTQDINVNGAVTATSFVGDGSGLTGITGGGDESGIGSRYFEITFDLVASEQDPEHGNYPAVPLDIDALIGFNNEWFEFEFIRVVDYVGENGNIDIGRAFFMNESFIPQTNEHYATNTNYSVSFYDGVNLVSSTKSWYSYSLNGEHVMDIQSGINGTVTLLVKVTSDW